MSLFAAMTTAVSGLAAQSDAIGNISDNLANSQTSGFKGIDTQFESLVTQSNQYRNDPGGVRATPHYTNGEQGNLTQSSSSTSLAISGQGFFPVRPAAVGADGTTTFDSATYFTRSGDFLLDKNGYLVNGAGYYLTGYNVDTNGVVDTSQAYPIQIAQLLDNPVATSAVDYAANLPASADVGYSTPPSTLQLYDTLGTQHNMTFSWTKTATNEWNLHVDVTDAVQTTVNGNLVTSNYIADIPFTFNSETTATAQAGTIANIASTVAQTAAYRLGDATNNVTFTSARAGTVGNGVSVEIAPNVVGVPNTYIATLTLDGHTETYNVDDAGGGLWANLATAVNGVSNFATVAVNGTGATAPTTTTAYALTGGTEAYTVISSAATADNAQVAFGLNFDGAGAQTITTTFGTYNVSTGTTQFADTTISVSTFDQNGIPRGSFQSLSIDENGYVALNYDNGRTRTIAQIPVVQFFAQDQLQRVSGGAFMQTLQSGSARYSAAGTNGAGSIVGNSLESSNVDIANEFTKLIQAQQVYSANAKTISTTNSMMQEVINIIR